MADSGRIFNMTKPEINIVVNYEDLCERVTEEILVLSSKKIASQGKFTMALAGGSTPKGIYECMVEPYYRNEFKWEKIHLFWGDERWVPHGDQRSNYRMVSEALISKVKIPSGNIHPVRTDACDPETSAHLYEKVIGKEFQLNKDEFPIFDLVLLGLGQDGHTASLFPGNPALVVKDRLVVSTSQEGIPEKRITLTLPVINHAAMIFFLISGQEKAGVVAEVLENKKKSNYPAKMIEPYQGSVNWFLDKAAASELENKYE
jgi:6-phosphogluconolactonase